MPLGPEEELELDALLRLARAGGQTSSVTQMPSGPRSGRRWRRQGTRLSFDCHADSLGHAARGALPRAGLWQPDDAGGGPARRRVPRDSRRVSGAEWRGPGAGRHDGPVPRGGRRARARTRHSDAPIGRLCLSARARSVPRIVRSRAAPSRRHSTTTDRGPVSSAISRHRSQCVSCPDRGGHECANQEGYEGIVVARAMLAPATVLIGAAKLIFGRDAAPEFDQGSRKGGRGDGKDRPSRHDPTGPYCNITLDSGEKLSSTTNRAGAAPPLVRGSRSIVSS